MKSIFSKPKVLISISLVAICMYFSPFIYFGEDSHIRIHDNLDSNLVWVKTLLNSGELFASPNKDIEQVFNGIPRSSLYGSYDISLIWFKLFGMYYGYVFNKIIMSIIAFFGMFFLLRKIIQPDKNSILLITTGVSLLFALLPFWSFSLSVSGLPLLLYAFLNIRNGDSNYSNWLIIGLFPFYSSLVLSGIFFIILLFLILVYDTYQNRKINVPFLSGIIALGGLYIVSHFPIVYSFIQNSDYVSHRTEMIVAELSFKNSYKRSESIFISGHYHAESLHKYILVPIVFIFIRQFFLKDKIKIYTYTFIFVLLVSLMYGFLHWSSILMMHRKLAEIIPIQIDRFYNLSPMFWYVLLAISLSIISKKWKLGKFVALGIFIFQFVFILKSHELITQKNEPTYAKFFSEEVFQEIKDFINRPVDSYRVVSIGIHPSIALYNGFYTLDGYFPDYPLQYKHDFRKIIEKELQKAPYLGTYFDTWGSRCYAFSQELGRSYLKSNPKKVEKLEFDFKALKNMGGDYIISSAEINTSKTNQIRLVEIFENYDSEWNLYLYETLDK